MILINLAMATLESTYQLNVRVKWLKGNTLF